MTMKIVKGGIQIQPVTKKMTAMANGEVCYLEKEGYYILKVYHMDQPCIYMILDNHKGANSYGKEGSNCDVRELSPNESITIKFS